MTRFAALLVAPIVIVAGCKSAEQKHEQWTCPMHPQYVSDKPGDWVELLPRSPLTPDRIHSFDAPLKRIADVTFVRLNIFPDGGVARLQVFSTLG